MSALAMMRHTGTIQRKTHSVSSTSGGPSYSWANAATGVPCSVQTVSQRESIRAGRETGVRAFDVFVPFGTDIRTQDRFVPASGAYANLTLTVTGVSLDDSGMGREYVVATCEEVKGGGTL